MDFKITVFDIETTGFEAESAADVMVCCSFLPLDQEEPYTIQMSHKEARSKTQDKKVLQRVLDELGKFEMLIGHNIIGFDLNWLFTRSIIHDLQMPRRWLYYDSYFAAKRMAFRGRKSLANLCSAFNIPGIKTAIQRPDRLNALSPDKEKFDKVMKDVVFHCEQDVILNKGLFKVLWPRDRKLVSLPFTKKW